MPTVLHYIKAPVFSALHCQRTRSPDGAASLAGGTIGLPDKPGLERLEKQVLIK